MPFVSIESLIASEHANSTIIGRVTGTPRTYGSRKTEDIWRTCIRNGKWKGIDDHHKPIDSPVFMTFSFRVNPQSAAYNRCVSPNGPDIDTMVIGALGGLIAGRNQDRPTLRLLSRGTHCWGYAATKEVVEDDSLTGVDITVSLQPAPSASEFRAMLSESDLTVKIASGIDRKQSARIAVESHNVKQRFYPACSPMSMMIAFQTKPSQRNITSAEHIEALIDGMGAAVVGERRFFDAPQGKYTKERYHFDDSCIFSILVGRVDIQDDPRVDAVVDIFCPSNV